MQVVVLTPRSARCELAGRYFHQVRGLIVFDSPTANLRGRYGAEAILIVSLYRAHGENTIARG